MAAAAANLPCVPVYDLLIKDDDLIAATHGRSFWILDDLTQVRQIADGVAGQPFHLLKPRNTYRPASAFRNAKPVAGKNYQRGVGGYVAYTETRGAYGETVLNFLDAGANPPEGVIVTYYLREKPSSDITLSFLDAQGQLIKAYSGKASDTATANKTPELRVPAEAGMNRFIWPMRYPEARLLPGDKLLTDKVVGPLAPPGTYQVRLDVNGTPQTQTFALLKDPRVAAGQADFEAQFALLLQIRDKLSATHDAVNTLRRIRQQVDEWTQRAAGHDGAEAVSQAAQTVKDKLAAVEDVLVQVNYRGARDRLNLPAKLNAKLAELPSVVAAADFAPPQQVYEVFNHLTEHIDQQLQRLREIIDKDVAGFQRLLDTHRIPAIVS